MSAKIELLCLDGRRAVATRNWRQVNHCARTILSIDKNNPEGFYLLGLSQLAAGQRKAARQSFSSCLDLDPKRYDSAVELASLEWSASNHQRAKDLLVDYETKLTSSPKYLFLAAETYSKLGLHARAWPLYQLADKLQPDADSLQAAMAACATKVGEIEFARSIYQKLIAKNPSHQRNHYELSRLVTAVDDNHVRQMKAVLDGAGLEPSKNIFMYYALGKQLEDLGQWEESFKYYSAGGDAAAEQCRAAGYSVSQDVELINTIVDVCSAEWISKKRVKPVTMTKTPVFVVGLPRTGTTLTERILSSHSQIETVDESFFLEMAIKKASRINVPTAMDSKIVEAAARADLAEIASSYMQAIDYRLSDKAVFVEKYPLNFLYLGFICKAFPNAKIVLLQRNPMDACVAMYKQPFFKFAYSLADLAQYYPAYDRLITHWLEVLNNITLLNYESLVSEPEQEIRNLLAQLELEFEPACLDFHLNTSASATASSAQIREKAHTRSVNKWRHWEPQLRSFARELQQAGIQLSPE